MARFRLLTAAAIVATTMTGLVPAPALAAASYGQGADVHQVSMVVSAGDGGGNTQGLLCQIFHIRCNNQ